MWYTSYDVEYRLYFAFHVKQHRKTNASDSDSLLHSFQSKVYSFCYGYRKFYYYWVAHLRQCDLLQQLKRLPINSEYKRKCNSDDVLFSVRLFIVSRIWSNTVFDTVSNLLHFLD
jgi:hypothetical protein